MENIELFSQIKEKSFEVKTKRKKFMLLDG